MLDELGVPWRLSRAELAKRYGVRRDAAYGWKVIEIATPDLKNLIRPLSAQVFPQFSKAFPAVDFSGFSSWGSDVRENVRRTADQLTRWLGPAEAGNRHNTFRCEWSFGPASVALLGWPDDLQRGPRLKNSAHDRDRRLATACHIWIKTGFRPAASVIERGWLDSFEAIRPIAVAHDQTAEAVHNAAAEQSELEFVREPGPELANIFGHIGRSADGAALIFCHAQLYVIAAKDVLGFDVVRMLPAKGGGGSRLYVECVAHDRGAKPKRLFICSGDEPDGLNNVAAEIAEAFGKRCKLGDYIYDY